MSSVCPNGERYAVCFIFDLDAEYVCMGNMPGVVEMPQVLSQGDYVWREGVISLELS